MLASPQAAETRGRLFASTRWTIVLEAANSGAASAQSLSALSELCRVYWRPLYLFLRSKGHSAEDAQDLTQGFFADLIETRAYSRANPEKGRFRSFLLGALKHFVADARDRDQAQKRGGGKVHEPFDEAIIAEAENQVARNERWQPDMVYDRAWAETLLRQALARLGQECAFAGKTTLFEALKSHLSPNGEKAASYDELSARVRRPAATLRKDAERLRARYGEILREEVCGTVTDPSDVDGELHYLCQAVTSG